MSEPAPSTYDELPYINMPFRQTHPGRLAALGRLFGMRTPAVETCRVLELGCASGDNLIPMALVLPDARFLGIDLSVRQIEQGQRTIAELGLTNIELRRADMADVDAGYGQFDYIISHGIYSWVPAPIREKLLSICRDHLVPDGVAYVSYNTLPGWGVRGMLREVMTYHSRLAPNAVEQVRQARAMLDFLGRGLPVESPYGALLRDDLQGLRQRPDAYLFHDHLEKDNEPVYFHQFVESAQRHGMQFLAEAEFGMMTLASLSPPVAQELRRMAPDVIAEQQYLDFLCNRTFRQTLLAHRDVTLTRDFDATAMRQFAIAAQVKSASRTPSLAQGAAETFRAPNGAALDTRNALTKIALLLLTRHWPAAIPFSELVTAARAFAQENTGAANDATTLELDAQFLGDEILQCYAVGIVELRVWSPHFCAIVSGLPTASPLARLQAIHGDMVTNLHHQRVTLDGLNRALLPLLDGSRDRTALVDALLEQVASGSLSIQQQGKALAGGPALENGLRAALEANLPKLAKSALLLR